MIRETIFDPLKLTIASNARLERRLRWLSLASDGMRGNTVEDIALIALRVGIGMLEHRDRIQRTTPPETR